MSGSFLPFFLSLTCASCLFPSSVFVVQTDYVHHKLVKAAMGVKISAAGLDNAVAGSSLLVCKKGDDIEELKDEVQGDLATILSKIDKSGQGVAVQASTLGSLEALLAFLADMKIPVASISIGPVHKKDVMKAAVMLEKRPEFGVMLWSDNTNDTGDEVCAGMSCVQLLSARSIAL
jgi:translation initiation factor 5B